MADPSSVPVATRGAHAASRLVDTEGLHNRPGQVECQSHGRVVGQSVRSHRMVVPAGKHRSTVHSAHEGVVEPVPVSFTVGGRPTKPRVVHSGRLFDAKSIVESRPAKCTVKVVLPFTEYRIAWIVGRFQNVEIAANHDRTRHVKRRFDDWQHGHDTFLKRAFVLVAASCRASRWHVEAENTDIAPRQSDPCGDTTMPH